MSKSNFEEKRAARIERLQDLADKNEALAGQLFDRAHQMADAIPFGQPILVGHHSEKRDRNYRNKIHTTMGRGVEASKKADYYKDRAAAAARNTAIFSDDPAVCEKLAEKIQRLEDRQALMTAANKHIKRLAASNPAKLQTAEDIEKIRAKNPGKQVLDIGSLVESTLDHRKPDVIGKVVEVADLGCGMIAHYVIWPPSKTKASHEWGYHLKKVGDGPVKLPEAPTETDKDKQALLNLGFSEKQIAELLKPDFCGRVGFPDYAIANNRANITRLKKRLQDEQEKTTEETTEREINGVRIVDNVEENRLQMFFDSKPSEAIRAELKGAGFRWSPREGAWQRHRNSGANWQAERIAEMLGGAADDNQS